MKFNYIQQTFFFVLLITTSLLFFWMLGKYLLPVFWAIVIAIIFYPLFLNLSRRLKGRNSTAAILAIGAVVLMVVLPLTLIGGLIVQESVELYQKLSQNPGELQGFSLLDQAEKLATYLEPYGVSQATAAERLREWTASASQTIASSLISVSQVTLSFVISTAIMLYLLFFFFRDGVKIKETLIHYIPLGNAYEQRLFIRFAETSRAVVKGSLTIALIQGTLGGIVFWIVGITNPVLWGAAMAFLAIIPAVGPAIIWVPASIILIANGSIWEGVTIIVVGIVLISVIDEFLRPVLVGRGSKMPDAIVLLSTIGGLTTFGVTGFVVGPIIAAFFLSLWVMFEEKYHKELSQN
ncbi:MAG TPA: AI-2E family transporter [Candidatus Paceibacterota bacterium]|nr:AI-2E family transporter [Candidatus Paceibacterota bacterium]HMO83021.1 AI-2E family transporter [Candidatus Paceibacterota bacterium]